jgi:hypothetical protein
MKHRIPKTGGGPMIMERNRQAREGGHYCGSSMDVQPSPTYEQFNRHYHGHDMKKLKKDRSDEDQYGQARGTYA